MRPIVRCFLLVERLKSQLGKRASKSVDGRLRQVFDWERNTPSRQSLPVRECDHR